MLKIKEFIAKIKACIEGHPVKSLTSILFLIALMMKYCLGVKFYSSDYWYFFAFGLAAIAAAMLSYAIEKNILPKNGKYKYIKSALFLIFLAIFVTFPVIIHSYTNNAKEYIKEIFNLLIVIYSISFSLTKYPEKIFNCVGFVTKEEYDKKHSKKPDEKPDEYSTKKLEEKPVATLDINLNKAKETLKSPQE